MLLRSSIQPEFASDPSVGNCEATQVVMLVPVTWYFQERQCIKDTDNVGNFMVAYIQQVA
jgi:hypothetical protein